MSSSSSGQFRLVDPENPSRQLVLSYAWECGSDKAASSINLSPTGFAGDSSQQESDDDETVLLFLTTNMTSQQIATRSSSA